MTLECRRLKEQIRIQLQSDRTSAGGGAPGGLVVACCHR